MTRESGVLSGGTAQRTPQPVLLRVTTGDFFTMFDVPFLYGGGWSARDDENTTPAIVLSRAMNNKLFGGVNSVGRTIRLDQHPFRVVGVMDEWNPIPKFYDLTTGAFERTEDAFIPFSWIPVLEKGPSGDEECWNPGKIHSFRDFLNSDCIWTQMWVELPDRASRQRMQSFVDAYWTQQHAAGRFPRPRDNRLTAVGQWLTDNDVVPNDNRMLVGLSLAFLAVCVINTVGILLAKFLGRSAITGVRRALGASRREIFVQHHVEVGLLAVVGALVGLAIAARGLWGLHALYASPDRGGYQELTHFDAASILVAAALAIVSALAAGFYPAWRIGRMTPAVYLKNQ
jgi:putative ABC transport system permease protein